MRDRDLDYEESFYQDEKKELKKERKALQKRDRSKYKHTDSKQRTTTLPDLTGCKKGKVISIGSKHIDVFTENSTIECTLKGSLKQQSNRQKTLVTIGDHVFFNKNLQIEAIEPRSTILCRAQHLKRNYQQLIAANVDQVFIVASALTPSFKPSLVDRYIIMAEKGGMSPYVIINKMDLLEPCSEFTEIEKEIEKEKILELVEVYQKLNIPCLCMSMDNEEGITRLREAMAGHTSVFSGQSGVGKSSIINASLGLSLKTSEVVQKTRKGSHTTTKPSLIPLEEGFCIDTPGIKSFGLWDIKPEDVVSYFPEIVEASKGCKFSNCQHINEPDCQILLDVDEGLISPYRYESYLSLLSDPSNPF